MRHLIAHQIARVRADSLARNSVGIMATSAITAALGYVYWIVAARALPTATVGLGSTVVSAMVIVSLAIYLGPSSILIARLPNRTTRDDWLVTVLGTLVVCCVATLVVAVIALFPLELLLKPLRPLRDDPVLALWYVFGAVGWTASGLLDSVYIAERRADFMFWRNAFSSALKLLVLIVLAVLPEHRGATTIVSTWALSGILGTFYGLYLCHRHFHRLGRIAHASTSLRAAMTEEALLLARPSAGHHAISVSGLLPTYLLPIVVTARLGTRENAYFYVTWMIGSAIFMISPAVSSAIFAEGSYDATRMRAMARASLKIIMAMIVPSTLIVGALGKPILHLYGADYAAAGFGLLLILLLSSYPDAITNISVATLRVRGALGRAAVLNGTMAVIAVAGAWVLAPAYGIAGAGSAWLIAQIVGTIGVIVLRRQLWPPADGTE